MIYYTSDLHFGHKNVLVFDQRPFADIDEMNQTLIDNWNNRVTNKDHVYVVGDFAYRDRKRAGEYLTQLKGHKHLLIGNHDGELLRNEEAMKQFESVDRLCRILDGNENVILCHFPLATWNKEQYGTWHVYGHIHGYHRSDRSDILDFMRSKKKALNAGCMINNYTPATLEELVENNERFWAEYEALTSAGNEGAIETPLPHNS